MYIFLYYYCKWEWENKESLVRTLGHVGDPCTFGFILDHRGICQSSNLLILNWRKQNICILFSQLDELLSLVLHWSLNHINHLSTRCCAFATSVPALGVVAGSRRQICIRSRPTASSGTPSEWITHSHSHSFILGSQQPTSRPSWSNKPTITCDNFHAGWRHRQAKLDYRWCMARWEKSFIIHVKYWMGKSLDWK